MSSAFEFAQPFTGDQPEIGSAEQQYVSATFSSHIDDTLLANL